MRIPFSLFLSLLVVGFVSIFGCGQADSTKLQSVSRQSEALAQIEKSTNSLSSRDKPQSGKLTSINTPMRKLVYSGEVKIQTEDFSDLERQLESKLSEYGGFIGNFTESRIDQHERHGIWTVRLPVDQFSAFVRWLDDSFHIVDKSIKSKDVTDEFVDLQSRLTNKRKTEQRLSEHLSKTTSKLSEILEMEKEMERVREDIERIEGRLNLLQDQAELSTIVVRVDSKKVFVAPKSPSSLSNLAAIFGKSCWLLVQISYSLMVIATAILPFAFVIGMIAWIIFLWTGQSPLRMLKQKRWRS